MKVRRRESIKRRKAPAQKKTYKSWNSESNSQFPFHFQGGSEKGPEACGDHHPCGKA